MARIAQESDFTVKVEGIGTFTFGRRTMSDEMAIQVAFARIIDGVEPTTWLTLLAGWFSVFRVLMVRAPAGWDINQMDPTDPESYAKLRLVHEALVEQERSFRRKPAPVGQGDCAVAASDG